MVCIVVFFPDDSGKTPITTEIFPFNINVFSFLKVEYT